MKFSVVSMTIISDAWIRLDSDNLSSSHLPIRRLVLDTRGLPVAGAQVMVEGVDKVTVTSERGEYWRLLLPGHYKSVLNTKDQYNTDYTAPLTTPP